MRTGTAIQIDPNKRAAIRAAMAKIGGIFPPYQDMTEAQWDSFAEDYITDLAEFAVVEIESAFLAYRQDPRSVKFPTPGRLRELATRARQDRAEVARPRQAPGKSRPQMWWLQPRGMWREDWSERDIPAGEKVRDLETGEFREPFRW